jgi:hypothetical protein
MAQHIWVKTLDKKLCYEWNFADIYNLLWNNYLEYELINSIDIYWDTIVKKENLFKLKNELEKMKKENNFKINNFINFLDNTNLDLLFIWD